MRYRSLFIGIISSCLLAACGSSDDDSDGDGLNGDSDSGVVTGDSDTGADPDAVDCAVDNASPLAEAALGDFSSDIENPTTWDLGPGANVLTAATSSADIDYVTVTVGPCDTLTGIDHTEYTSDAGDAAAFIAVQSGAVFTVTPETANQSIGELDGYTHYGVDTLNQNILTLAGTGAGAIGFTPPLEAGTYSFWLNQTGAEADFTLVFNVTRVVTP